MGKLRTLGDDIILTCSRRVDEASFIRACELVSKVQERVLEIEKSSIIIIYDDDQNSIVMERLNTDTFTLHVQYEIKSKNIIQINE